jgi:hypothetical protein
MRWTHVTFHVCDFYYCGDAVVNLRMWGGLRIVNFWILIEGDENALFGPFGGCRLWGCAFELKVVAFFGGRSL